MIRRDYLERLMDELAAIAAAALGHARAARPEEARREIDGAYAQVGVSALVLDRLDAASIRLMSGEKTAALARVLEADAEVAALAGDEPRAKRRRALALSLK